MKFFILLFCFFLTSSSFSEILPYTLVLSIDGFRHDYPDLFDLKFLKKIRSQSSSQQSLAPVYPSKTFPNHFSMVTGLYPDEHGIVGNFFYSKERKNFYSIKDKDSKNDPSWYEAEPIWIALEKKNVFTASYYWPISDVFIDGFRPHYVRVWDEDKDLTTNQKARLDQVFEWLSLPVRDRPHLVFAYLAQIDEIAHQKGPDSEELMYALKKLDSYLESFYEKLKTLSFPVNIIVCSDHGMTRIKQENILFLNELVLLSEDVKIVSSGSLVQLYFEKEEEKKTVYKSLKEKESNKFTLYLKEELPEKYHLKKSKNSGDLLLVVNYPYYLMKERVQTPREGGDHGYDPKTLKDMHGIYYSLGEDLKKIKVNVRETKDIYFVLRRLYSPLFLE